MCVSLSVYFQYSGDQVLFILPLQWEVSHELHYSWGKHLVNMESHKMNSV